MFVNNAVTLKKFSTNLWLKPAMPREEGTRRLKVSTKSALQIKAIVICIRPFYKEIFEEI